MIRIELDLAVAIYLSLSLVILLVWLVYESRGRSAGSLRSPKSLWQCPLCFYFYIDSLADDISRCPQCGSLHRKGEKETKAPWPGSET
jgi:hypothetical protein